MFKTVILVVILTLVVQHLIEFFQGRDLFASVQNHSPGPCRILEGISNGSEDIETLPSGKTFISSGLKAYHDPDNPSYRGRTGQIFLFDFNNPWKLPEKLNITGKFDEDFFEPHGMSVLYDEQDVILFVINHGNSEETVEKFHFDETSETLHHMTTYKDVSMRHMNDLVATGKNTFYFTNYEYYTTMPLREISRYLLLSTASVVYFDGKTYSVVADGYRSLNGINISPDSEFLYVSESGRKKLHVFQRRPDGSLLHFNGYTLHTMPDNIMVEAHTGDLWIGAHPVAHLISAHENNPSLPSPSQVLRVKMEKGTAVDVQEIYSNDGTTLSGSSVAVKYGDTMLIGSVYHMTLYCYLDAY